MGVGLLPWLLSIVFPLCATHGAAGVTRPGIVDFDHLVRPHTPNTALAAPAGFKPKPDIITPLYDLPASRLFTIVTDTASHEKRTYPLDSYPTQLQAAFVVRSRRANFPDIVEIAVIPDGQDASRLILYSHSIYGYSDFGVNRARLHVWLGAIADKVGGDAS